MKLSNEDGLEKTKSLPQLPTKEEIEKLWGEFGLTEGIKNHIKGVTKVATFLAKKLNEKGEDINVELVEKSALLHDLARACDFKDFSANHKSHDKPNESQLKIWKRLKEKYFPLHHSDAACEFLKERYPELSTIVRKHKFSGIGTEDAPKTWEEKLVHYSDKRVAHDQIVTIQGRQSEALERYPEHKKHLKQSDKFSKLEELEKEIFSRLDFKPEDLKEVIKE
jgi:HD superfamily phosphodiesterase